MPRFRGVRRALMGFLGTCAIATGTGCAPRLPDVVPNDNRTAAGSTRAGVREVILEARLAAWRPDLSADSSLTVPAFADADRIPRIPGPLIRLTLGDSVRVIVANALPDSTLTVHGLTTGDTLGVRVAPGTRDTIVFAPEAIGTFLYWGTTRAQAFGDRIGRDGQLTGAIVVDDPTRPADSTERIFVITTTDVYTDSAAGIVTDDDVFDQAINGRSWPHTERLEYAVGDTVRWRWVNGGYLPHPMHLHGFHFRVTAKGNGHTDTLRTAAMTGEAVTEFMRAGSTFAMSFVPTRGGNWLFHCHMVPHVVPFPSRSRDEVSHTQHDATAHVMQGMSGLVIGVTVSGADGAMPEMPTERRWVYVQQAARASIGDTVFRRGYVVRTDAAPRADSVAVPGAPLVLTHGVRTAITVVNRLPEATTVHWHGLEIESYYDGVAGWSGGGARLAPLIAPGDSFTVVLTPPRAGTFMYHPHMEESDQLQSGLFGPLLVLAPGERYQPDRELLVVLGDAVVDTARGHTINGSRTPAPVEVRVGTTYRVRILSIGVADPLRVQLVRDTVPLIWRLLAKDGADAPEARRTKGPARLIIGVGETYDFLWTPDQVMDAALSVGVPIPGAPTLTLPVRVRR